MMISKSPVLLLGFNRIEHLKIRLEEIISWEPPHIYVSIDGPKIFSANSVSQEIKNFLWHYKNHKNITLYINEKNLGLSHHITKAISKVLEIENNLIIIEDDIEIFKNAYMSMSQVLNNPNISNFGIVSGFSLIPSPPNILKNFLPNKFRITTYTSIWGWGIRKDVWEFYQLDLSNLNLELEVSKSNLWNNLSLRQKNIWLQRFMKVAKDPRQTWDFQMQFLCFRYNLPNLSPIFRAVDNVGFGDDRSTNTKNKKPRFYFGKTDYRTIEGVIWGGFIPRIADFADSFSDLIPYLKRIMKLRFR